MSKHLLIRTLEERFGGLIRHGAHQPDGEAAHPAHTARAAAAHAAAGAAHARDTEGECNRVLRTACELWIEAAGS